MKQLKHPYAEVVIKACSGETEVLVFDRGNFKASKDAARRVARKVLKLAESGHTVAREKAAHPDWFAKFKPMEHIAVLTVNKRVHGSGATRTVHEEQWPCEHKPVWVLKQTP